jgi:hypothetical protein
MHLLALLRKHLSALFAAPAFAGAAALPYEGDGSQASREAVRDVTMEQLGSTHWTFHTLF